MYGIEWREWIQAHLDKKHRVTVPLDRPNSRGGTFYFGTTLCVCGEFVRLALAPAAVGRRIKVTVSNTRMRGAIELWVILASSGAIGASIGTGRYRFAHGDIGQALRIGNDIPLYMGAQDMLTQYLILTGRWNSREGMSVWVKVERDDSGKRDAACLG